MTERCETVCYKAVIAILAGEACVSLVFAIGLGDGGYKGMSLGLAIVADERVVTVLTKIPDEALVLAIGRDLFALERMPARRKGIILVRIVANPANVKGISALGAGGRLNDLSVIVPLCGNYITLI